MISDVSRLLITEYAENAYPEECCGYVLRDDQGNEVVHPCPNVHERPKEHFKIDEVDTVCALAVGKIICVYHSHPDTSAQPSPLDKACCYAMDLPWVIYATPLGDWRELLPEEHFVEYEGREFFWGVQDCYTLLRDWMRHERNIVLNDYPRVEDFWQKGLSPYIENFEKEGFVVVTDDIRVGDVFLHKLKSKEIPNHASVYQGNGQILHHVYGLLSVIEPLTGLWGKTIHSRYRHKTLC